MTQIDVHAESNTTPVHVHAELLRGVPRISDLPAEEMPSEELATVASLDAHRATSALAQEREASDRAIRHAKAGFVSADEYRGVGDNAKAIELPQPRGLAKASRWMIGKIGGPDIVAKSEAALGRLDENDGERSRKHTALVGPAVDPEIKAWSENRANRRRKDKLSNLGRIGTHKQDVY